MTAPTPAMPSWSELYRPPTRDKALEIVARNLAGPWAGPPRAMIFA